MWFWKDDEFVPNPIRWSASVHRPAEAYWRSASERAVWIAFPQFHGGIHALHAVHAVAPHLFPEYSNALTKTWRVRHKIG